jgi:hypothetical protein
MYSDGILYEHYAIEGHFRLTHFNFLQLHDTVVDAWTCELEVKVIPLVAKIAIVTYFFVYGWNIVYTLYNGQTLLVYHLQILQQIDEYKTFKEFKCTLILIMLTDYWKATTVGPPPPQFMVSFGGSIHWSEENLKWRY